MQFVRFIAINNCMSTNKQTISTILYTEWVDLTYRHMHTFFIRTTSLLSSRHNGYRPWLIYQSWDRDSMWQIVIWKFVVLVAYLVLSKVAWQLG